MSKRKKYNPERRAWRGRSYRKYGERITELRSIPIEDDIQTTEGEPDVECWAISLKTE